MKFAAALLAFCLVAVAVANEKYTTKYDNVDIDNILGNDRLLKNYINCVLDKAKCSPDGQELKSHIKEALETGCKKCSEKQREGTTKVLKFLQEKKQKEFKELEAKYDPDGKWRVKYADEIKKHGVTV